MGRLAATPPSATAVVLTHTYRPADAEPRWDMVRCARCFEPWYGDPETGGCTARMLALEVLRLRAVLHSLTPPVACGASWPVGDN